MQNSEPETQKLVSKREIARRYGVSERTVQEWMVKGMIPYYKPGYIVRFDPAECDSALNRFKVPVRTLAIVGQDRR
jgi:excisionase family DNA binding protein